MDYAAKIHPTGIPVGWIENPAGWKKFEIKKKVPGSRDTYLGALGDVFLYDMATFEPYFGTTLENYFLAIVSDESTLSVICLCNL